MGSSMYVLYKKRMIIYSRNTMKSVDGGRPEKAYFSLCYIMRNMKRMINIILEMKVLALENAT